MPYRNLTMMDGRRIPISSPHFSVSYIDERDILANILAIVAGHSPTRGLFYSTQLPDNKGEGLLPSLLSSRQISDSKAVFETLSDRSRFGLLMSAMASVLNTENGSSPMNLYLKTLRHSDLFESKDADKGQIIPTALLTLIHEQTHTVVDYPIGTPVLTYFKSLVHNPQILEKKRKSAGTGAVERQYGKYDGAVLAARKFGSYSSDSQLSPDSFKLLPRHLRNITTIKSGLAAIQADGATMEGEGYVSSLIAADMLLQMDNMIAVLRSLSVPMLSNKPEDKIGAIRKAITLMSVVALQPYFMYIKIVVDLLNNDVVKRYLSSKFPRLYDTTLMADMVAMTEGLKFSPLYAEMLRHVASGSATTTLGDSPLLTVPVGALDMVPFLAPPSQANAKATAVAADLSTAIATQGLLLSFGSDKEEYLMAFLQEARSLYEIYIAGSGEMEAEVSSIYSALAYQSMAFKKAVNRADVNVMVSDGLTANIRPDLDNIHDSILLSPYNLLFSSPHRRLIVVDSEDSRSIQIASQFYEYTDTISSVTKKNDVVVKAKAGSFSNMLDSGVMPFMIRRHAWFDRFSINAALVLNGRLPMSRYMLDSDASIIPHTTFSNLAADLAMDPNILASLITGGDNENSIFGSETVSLLREFFVQLEGDGKATNIPDAKQWGLEKWAFKFGQYFTSSRAAVYHQYSEVIVNSLVPAIQRIQYTEWTKSGAVNMPVCRPAFVDRAFQASVFSSDGITMGACEDAIIRLKL